MRNSEEEETPRKKEKQRDKSPDQIEPSSKKNRHK